MTAWFYYYVATPGPPSSAGEVIVDIPSGSSVRDIAGILAEAGVIREDIRFLVLAQLSGKAKKLQAGEFRIGTGMVPGEVLSSLASAKPVQHIITIPEGYNLKEIADMLGARGWIEPENFLSLARDSDFLGKLGLAGLDTVEGYLFPDTYYLTKNMIGSGEIISLMVKRFHEVWQSLVQETGDNVDRDATITLASIVEKETGDPAERARIAGVFVNRLKLGMKLQSDPTVIYGVEGFAGAITKQQLRQKTPYNTYVVSGLPRGPICNPGEAAIRAVLFPEQSKYLYFVSKNDGTHVFSVNLRDHNKAVKKYQRKKKGKEGK